MRIASFTSLVILLAVSSDLPRFAVRHAAFEQVRSSRLSARWLGQDGHDYVGPHERLAASDIQDIHIAIAGLDPGRAVVFVEVRSTNGNFWRFAEKPEGYRAEFKRAKGARTGDVFFEPATVETGRPFHVTVRYEDGSTAETDLAGGKADDKLRVKTVALAARWIGQDRQDRTGAGPSVGGDGLQDVRIHVSRLSTKLTLQGIRVVGTGGATWESGPNPKLSPSAELVRDAKNPTQGDLFFQPNRDLTGQRLKLLALYDNDQVDTTTVSAGRCDPALRMPQLALPKFSDVAAEVRWLGQDGLKRDRAGRRAPGHFGAGESAGGCGGRAQQLAARRVDLPQERADHAGTRPIGRVAHDHGERSAQVTRRVLPTLSG